MISGIQLLNNPDFDKIKLGFSASVSKNNLSEIVKHYDKIFASALFILNKLNSERRLKNA